MVERYALRGDNRKASTKIVSTMAAMKYLRKGCDAYLAFVVDKRKEGKELKGVPMVNEFEDVFLEELPGLPPEREIEFEIELLLGTSPISQAPNRMALAELKELKVQLQELSDKGFIRTSFSLWGAPLLFIKKKDWSMRLWIDYR